MIKICKKHNCIKEFRKRIVKGEPRREWVCLQCESERGKQYYQENKEDKISYQNNYYETNKDSILEYKHDYYQENKEDILEYKHDYYHENKEEVREASK